MLLYILFCLNWTLREATLVLDLLLPTHCLLDDVIDLVGVRLVENGRALPMVLLDEYLLRMAVRVVVMGS